MLRDKALINPNRIKFKNKKNAFAAKSNSGIDIAWWVDLRGKPTTFFPLFQ